MGSLLNTSATIKVNTVSDTPSWIIFSCMRLKGRRIAERGEATVRNAWYTITMLKNDNALAAMRRLSMLFPPFFP